MTLSAQDRPKLMQQLKTDLREQLNGKNINQNMKNCRAESDI